MDRLREALGAVVTVIGGFAMFLGGGLVLAWVLSSCESAL